MRLSDGVLSLRPITIADAHAHLAGVDSDLLSGLDGGASTLDGVSAHFERRAAAWADEGPLRTFAITQRTDDILVGTLDVRTECPYLAAGQANLVCELHPRRRERGLATRAVVLGCRFLAGAGLAEEAVLRIDPADTMSVAAARRAGFHYFRSSAEPDEGLLDWYYQAV